MECIQNKQIIYVKIVIIRAIHVNMKNMMDAQNAKKEEN